MIKKPEIPVNTINLSDFINDSSVSIPKVSIYRTDLTDNEISGNKWYKLKYNIIEAKQRNLPILTFGGAFSNHIAATAAAGKKYNIKTIGVIRGEEYFPLNSTLQKAVANGMELHYISRSEYKNKYSENIIKALKNKFGDFFLVPEGGSNHLALKGVKEMLTKVTDDYNYIVLAAGTGGTAAGLYLAKNKNQKLLVIPVLKGADWLPDDISKLTGVTLEQTITFLYNYHFGGYAKVNTELIEFANNFYSKFNIPLDLIYTAKAMYGLTDLVKKKYFTEKDKILFIHTGGLQGNIGIKEQKQIDLKY
jgi:1-aminocyclopropane-1-carboxylate deaminase